MVSLGVGSVSVNVQDVPNGPIRFKVCFLLLLLSNEDNWEYDWLEKDDLTNTSRGNDASIGYTWKTFIDNSSNVNVPLNLPMTKVKSMFVCFFDLSIWIDKWKAAYKAMDAVQLFLKQINVTVPQTFIISGFSKVNSFYFFQLNRIEMNREDGQVRYLKRFEIEKQFQNQLFSLVNRCCW